MTNDIHKMLAWLEVGQLFDTADDLRKKARSKAVSGPALAGARARLRSEADAVERQAIALRRKLEEEWPH